MTALELRIRIGYTFRQARLDHGYTQRDVAKELKCSISYVSQVERGRTNIGLDAIARFATFYGLSVTDILA